MCVCVCGCVHDCVEWGGRLSEREQEGDKVRQSISEYSEHIAMVQGMVQILKFRRICH